MTAVVVDLAAYRTGLQADAVLAGVCVSLAWHGGQCHGQLTYRAGRWEHIGAGCGEAQPATCQHGTCSQNAEVGQLCAAGAGHCCGCCWIRDDDLEGQQLWPTR